MNTMRELFEEARIYGRVFIFTQDNGTYSVNITFNSIVHTKLEANSGYGFKDVEDALRAAIASAKKIVDSVSDIQKRLISK